MKIIDLGDLSKEMEKGRRKRGRGKSDKIKGPFKGVKIGVGKMI